MAKPEHDPRRTALLSSPLFQAMRPEELDEILTLAHERRFKRGQTILQKDDSGSSLMAVLRGRVRISVMSSEGKEMTLNVINPGEVFGEIALLDGEPRSADATAMEEAALLVVERRLFLPFLSNNHDLMLRLLMVLCKRLRQTSLALEQVALFDLPERLARLLLRLESEHGRPAPNGIRIDFKLSQRDLSMLVAASRESVNKQLGAWREEGLLSLDDGYIVLHDKAGLLAQVELQ